MSSFYLYALAIIVYMVIFWLINSSGKETSETWYTGKAMTYFYLSLLAKIKHNVLCGLQGLYLNAGC